MLKIIKATQFRRNARSVIDDVADEQMTYIVTRYGKPQAVLLTYAQYQQFFAATEPDLSGGSAPFVFEGSMNAPTFETYVAALLAPSLRPRDIGITRT